MSVTPETRQTVIARSNGYCEICHGTLTQGMSIHHRKPRQMGGSIAKWINEPENLLAICGSGVTGCHGKVESFRITSYDYGWLLRTGSDPRQVPFRCNNGDWWLLTGDTKIQIQFPCNPTSTP